jgi:hypothetical protein
VGCYPFPLSGATRTRIAVQHRFEHEDAGLTDNEVGLGGEMVLREDIESIEANIDGRLEVI